MSTYKLSILNIRYVFIGGAALLLLGACTVPCKRTKPLSTTTRQQVHKLSEILAEAEKNDDLAKFLTYYDENAISMPEYQPTLQGYEEIKTFYQAIFQRQKIKSFQLETEEIIDLRHTLIEIGTFTKEYTEPKSDTLVLQHGKYWHVWAIQPDGNFKLKGEAFGFFHSVEHPERLLVHLQQKQSGKSDSVVNQKTPLELQAYNALMEKGVRNRDGVLRSEFFTNDARFMPFQEPTVTTMGEIKPYLIAYNSRGKVTIDSIAVYTYHSTYVDGYVLEYPKFRVTWRTPQFSGRTEGKGIRIWKRQSDHSLKIYREIGLHDHLE